ncbi:MAG: FtsX-like permease family protein [Lachnospiraceae bacterium]
MNWTKKFRQRKMQSVMIFVMTCICELLMASALTILSSLDQPYHDLAKEVEAPEVRVYPMASSAGRGKDWNKELEKLDCVKEVAVVKQHLITEKVKANGKEINLFIRMVEHNLKVYKKVRRINGNMDNLKEDECLIPSTLANQKNISVGDKITVSYGKQKFSYKVKAVFADVYSLNSSYSLDILVTQIPKELKADSYYALYLKEGKKGQDAVEEYLRSHDGMLDANFHTREERISNAHLSENILGAILFALSVVIFFVAFVMIRYIIRNALIQDKKTIAVYKAIGYNERMIRGIYVCFYQFLVLTGTVFGIVLSKILTYFFMQSAFENLGRADAAGGIVQGLLCAVGINAFVYMGILFELKKVRTMKPQELLSGSSEMPVVKEKKEFSRRNFVGFSPSAMAFRMIERDKKNTVMIILTCFLSIFLVNMAVVSLDNVGDMRAKNYYWLGFDRHDVTIQNTGDTKEYEHVLEEIRKDKNVTAVVKRNLEVGLCIPYEQGANAMVYEDYGPLFMPVISGRNPKNKNEIVISNYYAKKMHKEIGDYIDVFLGDGTDSKVSLLIVGTCQGFYGMGKSVRIHSNLLTSHDIPFVCNEASVYLKKGSDRNAFLKKINEEYHGKVKVIPREDLYDSIIDEIVQPQKAALGPFILLALLLGTLNLVYIIYLKNVNGRHTYSIYKSIGYSAAHLIKMNCIYVLVIAFVSMAVAVPLFMISFPKVMVFAMSMFGFAEYQVTYHASTVILGNGIVLLMFLFGVILSSGELKKNHLETLVAE